MRWRIPVCISNRYITLTVLAVGYLTILIYLSVFLNYDLMRSDVLSYWQDSLDWRTPFDPFHVPGYPLLLAILRGISFGILPPLYLMVAVNSAAFLGSGWLIMDILNDSGTSKVFASVSALLFGLWPFVGLTYTVTPLADLPAIFLFLLGLYLLQRSRWFWSAFFLGISLIFHKALWPIAALILAADFIYRQEYFTKRNVIITALVLLPLGSLWLAGSVYHQSLGWILESNLKVEFITKNNFPIVDGIIGTLMSGGIKGLIKGTLLLGFFAVSTGAIWMAVRNKGALRGWSLGIAIAICLLFLVLNQNEIWAAVRFSRLLVIPLAGISPLAQTRLEESRTFMIFVISLLITLFLSQFFYSWYLARVYFA